MSYSKKTIGIYLNVKPSTLISITLIIILVAFISSSCGKKGPKTPKVNRPPVLEDIGNRNIFQGNTLEFKVNARDPDHDKLVFSATNLPQGATFDSTTRIFSFTPESYGNYENITFNASDGRETATETVSITVFQVIPQTLETVNDLNLPLAIFYHGDATEEVVSTITTVKPQYFICNTSHGLWGQFSDHKSSIFIDLPPFKEKGIKVIGYITACYENNKTISDIGPEWCSLEKNRTLIRDMAEIDQVDGVFIDECSSLPDEKGKAYLKDLTDLAHEYGLITWGNVGRSNFDTWFLKDGGFDMIQSTEKWRAQELSKEQSDWGYRISATGFDTDFTAQDAFQLTANAMKKGLAYCYVSDASAGYNSLPSWLTEYADLINQFRSSPDMYQVPAAKGNTTGIIIDTPVTGGGYDEYNFTFRILDTTVEGLTPGQEVWCAASENDFPNMLIPGVKLTGDMDDSAGWWTLKFVDHEW